MTMDTQGLTAFPSPNILQKIEYCMVDSMTCPRAFEFLKYGLWIKKSHSGSVVFKGHQENISLAHGVSGNFLLYQLMGVHC